VCDHARVSADNAVRVEPEPTKPLRERIEEVSVELFAQQGYSGTLLRQIAERLGVTKAAVYYHFKTKEEIARVLASRSLDVLTAMGDRLFVAGTDLSAWRRALPQIVDLAIKERELLFMYERNEGSFNILFGGESELGIRISEAEARLAAVFADSTIDPQTRIRLGCTYGAIFGPLLNLSNHFHTMPTEELRDGMLDILNRMLDDS